MARTVTNRGLQIWCSIALVPLALKERQEAGSETPEQDHGGTEEDAQVDAAKRASEPKRDSRYDAADAEMLVHAFAMRQDDPNACPYENPIYWAGFQIIGGNKEGQKKDALTLAVPKKFHCDCIHHSLDSC